MVVVFSSFHTHAGYTSSLASQYERLTHRSRSVLVDRKQNNNRRYFNMSVYQSCLYRNHKTLLERTRTPFFSSIVLFIISVLNKQFICVKCHLHEGN
mgnify:CR=1 FL=1